MRQKQQNNPALQLGIIHHHAAGIDVGSMNMMVSYTAKDGSHLVKEYDAFTDDLRTLASDLKEAGITHVGMEATGVYWMAVYELLEAQGLTVTLVNARNYRNVAGHKTDVQDCQWLHQLHAHGLLRQSHIADEDYRELRTYLHERRLLLEQKSNTLNRIAKVLTQMNIKVQHLISDIEGVIGSQIISRIAAGISCPEALLKDLDIKKLKATRVELEKSLTGNFKPHYVTVLKNHLEICKFYKERMLVYEGYIESVLARLLPSDSKPVGIKKTKARKGQYHFNVREYLEKIAGVDLTKVPGLDENAVLSILAIVGLNMHKWPTGDHFVSWLNLSARPRKSGGKVIGHQKRFNGNPASQAFRMAAQTMWQHKGTLGHLYRRLSATKGSKKAIKAIARRLALIFYNMLKKQVDFDPKKVALDEERIKEKKLARLKKEAEKLGYKIQMATA